MSSSNNKLIVKNTLVLYGQMLIKLIIGLYTGRIVLSALGVVDYGIYNIAGGVISSLWFITSALASASTRYLVYGLGKGDIEALKRTFGNILTVHFTLAAIILVLAETVGLWFVMHKLVIPEERLTAAVWVYQFSILSFLVNIISAPYNGTIIAHEKMTMFAFISLLEGMLKLCIVFLIMACSFDRLIFYAFLVLCVSVMNRVIYGIYCARHFEETKVHFSFDKEQYKEILSYAGWMCAGNVAHMCCREGFNILLNLFYGPVVNAARALAVMVQGHVEALGNEFQVAMKPQIIKNYAEGDYEHMQFLIFSGAKCAFYLSFAFALPVVLEIHQFLDWWLEEVPQWTQQFTIVLVCISCVEVIGVSLYNAVSATGNMKRYQLGTSIVLILFIPVAYVVLRIIQASPVVAFVILLFFYVVNMFVCAIIALRQLEIPFGKYMRHTLLPIAAVVVVASPLPFILRSVMAENVWSFFAVCGFAVVCVLSASYYVGCNRQEKAMIKNIVMARFFKKKK